MNKVAIGVLSTTNIGALNQTFVGTYGAGGKTHAGPQEPILINKKLLVPVECDICSVVVSAPAIIAGTPIKASVLCEKCLNGIMQK